MPVGDLGGPAGDGTTQLVDLEWAGFVLEVVCELQGVSESEDQTLDLVVYFQFPSLVSSKVRQVGRSSS